MKKLLVLGAAVFLLAAGCNSSQPSAQNTTGDSMAQQTPAAGNPPAAMQNSPQGQGVASVSVNNGSVAGVDLSEFGTEANQSASMSEQDGASDASVMSSDGASINSSTDSVNNPIQ